MELQSLPSLALYFQSLTEIVEKIPTLELRVWCTLTYSTDEGERSYPLYFIVPKGFPSASLDSKIDKPAVLIRAGIHPNELSGPYSVLECIGTWSKIADEHGVVIIVCPLGNPSGFPLRRFNIVGEYGDLGELGDGNNDAVRYRVKRDGQVMEVVALWPNDEFLEWRTLWDESEGRTPSRLPTENKAFIDLMHFTISACPEIYAFIDLHQDPFWTEEKDGEFYHPVAGYAYYANPAANREIALKVAEIIPPLANVEMTSGYDREEGTYIPQSDEQGIIHNPDGSDTEYFHLLTGKQAITVETTSGTLLCQAIAVNSKWVIEMIEAAGKGRK